MERSTRAAVPLRPEARACPGCGSPIEATRCGHCGVALGVGPYQVLQVLAQGPHGRMYLAEDAEGRKVALKELVFALVPSTEQLEAFEREAVLLRQLDHPGVPRFLGGFRAGTGVQTRLYLALEYVPGESLARALEHHRFTENEVRGIAEEVLEILVYLHGLSPKVLHRDIKPANLLRDPEGSIRLVDFGTARDLSGQRTHRSTLVGTFGYMPPEQLGGTVDVRSDLYALGATLLHLLAHKPPESMLGTGFTLDFRRHVDVTVRTERFLARLVASRPEDRFSSAREALAFLRGERSSSGLRRVRPPVVLAAGVATLAAGAMLARWMPQTEPGVSVPAPVASKAQLAPAGAAMGSTGQKGQDRDKALLAQPPAASSSRVAPLPPSKEIPFDWIMAKWELGRPGRWVQDTSGRDHHGLVPDEGVHGVFGGLEFEGTNGVVEIPDHPDLALRPPFTIMGNVKFLPSDAPGVIIVRKDGQGREAYRVETLPGRKLRFSITDRDGQQASVEGELPPDKSGGLTMLYATLDEAGDMRLYAGCALLGRKSTSITPSPWVVPGSAPSGVSLGGMKGQHLGFHGEIWHLELMRGVMEARDNCSFSLKMAD